MKLSGQGILDHVTDDGQEIRRGPLALSLEYFKVIQEYFKKEGRKPTDIEIESLAFQKRNRPTNRLYIYIW